MSGYFCAALDALIIFAFTVRGPTFGRTSAACAMIGMTWYGVGAPWWLIGAIWASALVLFAIHIRREA
jgi:hypothetical protein